MSQHFVFLTETGDMYKSEWVQRYIQHDNDVKRWANDLIDNKREIDQIILRGDGYILLPDTRQKSNESLNWLAFMTNPELRCIRDLRICHVKLLTKMHEECIKKILQTKKDCTANDVVCYAHYPPGVYRLHFHFRIPVSGSSAYELFRIHPIENILSNLSKNKNYYEKCELRIPIYENGNLFKALKSATLENS